METIHNQGFVTKFRHYYYGLKLRKDKNNKGSGEIERFFIYD